MNQTSTDHDRYFAARSREGNTPLMEFWAEANQLLASWHLSAMRYGPARDYFRAGLTPKEAAEKEYAYQLARREV